MGKIN